MHAGALRALEFDRIVEVIRGFAQTPQGEAHLGALEPATDPRTVASALAATSETVRFLAEAQIAVQAPSELEVILGGIGVEGRPLEPLHLIALANFLTTVATTCGAIPSGRSTRSSTVWSVTGSTSSTALPAQRPFPSIPWKVR